MSGLIQLFTLQVNLLRDSARTQRFCTEISQKTAFLAADGAEHDVY